MSSNYRRFHSQQRANAPARITELATNYMSLRTQEALRCQIERRPFRLTADIVAEDALYALRRGESYKVRDIADHKYLRVFQGANLGDQVEIVAQAQNADDTWETVAMVMPATLMNQVERIARDAGAWFEADPRKVATAPGCYVQGARVEASIQQVEARL